MSDLPSPAHAPRNKRSDRHITRLIGAKIAPSARQKTGAAQHAGAKPAQTKPARTASARPQQRAARGKAKGKFPLRACAALALALAVAILALVLTDKSLQTLRAQRERERLDFEARVARYTVNYRAFIENYAAQNAVHPAFIAAIILRESSYEPTAVSSAGARGLMQIMPDTFDFVRGKLDESTTFDDMFDAETNIRYGCWYIGYLSRLFDGDPVKIACAYHAGPNNVKLWIMNHTADGQTLALPDIPMEDTRYYAGKVCEAYAIYFQYHYPDAA